MYLKYRYPVIEKLFPLLYQLIRLGRHAFIQLKYYTLAHFIMKQLEDFLHDN